jgi:hypothetical protein
MFAVMSPIHHRKKPFLVNFTAAFELRSISTEGFLLEFPETGEANSVNWIILRDL